MKKVNLTVVNSDMFFGKLSLREENGKPPRDCLPAAGFKVGDKVVLILEKDLAFLAEGANLEEEDYNV